MIAKSTFWSKKTLVNEGYTIELYPNNIPPYHLFIEDAGLGTVIPIGYQFAPVYGSIFTDTIIYAGLWTNAQSFSKWDVVFYDNNLWISGTINQNKIPSEASEFWYLLKPVLYEAGVVDETIITSINTEFIYDVEIEKTYDEKNLSLGFPKVDNLKFKVNYFSIYDYLFNTVLIEIAPDFDTHFYYLVLLNALINPTINLSTILEETGYKGLDLSIDNPLNFSSTSLTAWKDAHRIQNKFLANVYSVKKNEDINPFNQYLLNLSVQNNRYELDMDIFNTEKVLDIETESMVSYLFKMLSWEQLELLSQVIVEGELVARDIDIFETRVPIDQFNIIYYIYRYKEELPTFDKYQSTYQFYNQIWRKFYTLLYKYFFQFQYATDAAIKADLDSLLPVAQTNTQRLTPYAYHEYYLPECFDKPNETNVPTYTSATSNKSNVIYNFYDLSFYLNHPVINELDILSISLNYEETNLGKWKNIYQFLNQEYINNSCIFNYKWFDSLVLDKEFNPIINFEGSDATDLSVSSNWFEKLLNVEDMEQPKLTYRTNITKGINNSQTEAANNDKDLKKYEVTDKTIESTFILTQKDNYFNGNTTLNDVDIVFEDNETVEGDVIIKNRNTTNPFLFVWKNGFAKKIYPEIAMFKWISTTNVQFAIRNNNPVTGGTENRGYAFDYIPTYIGDFELIRNDWSDKTKVRDIILKQLQNEQKNSLIKTQANFLFDNFKTIKNSTIEGTIPILNKVEYYPLYAGAYGYFVDSTNTNAVPTQIQQFLTLQNNFIIFLSSKLNLENNEATNKYLILSK